jgi:hypothetical protein
MTWCTIEAEGSARELLACAGVVCFCKLNSFVRASIRKTVHENAVVREARVNHDVESSLELPLLLR